MKNLKLTSILIFTCLYFTSCTQKEVKTKTEQTTTSITPLFNSNKIESQNFTINLKKDTVLIGKSGTKILIRKNSFTDKFGNIVTDNIAIELKEALTPLDMLIGNLTTLSNGAILESDGMVYINATTNNKQLQIAESESLEVSIPSLNKKEGMMFYTGKVNPGDNTINWVNPVDFIKPVIKKNSVVKPVAAVKIDKDESNSIEFLDNSEEFVAVAQPIKPLKPLEANATDNRIMSIKFEDAKNYPELQQYDNVKFRVNDNCDYNPNDSENYWYNIKLEKTENKGEYTIILQGQNNTGTVEKKYTVTPAFDGEDLKKAIAEYDSKFKEYEKKLEAAEKEKKRKEKLAKIAAQKRAKEQAENQIKLAEKRANSNLNPGITDSNVSYTLSMKNLGWANVDRLYSDSRTKEVELNTQIVDNQKYENVHITLIFKNQKIQIPGYQMKDKSYGFTHGDYENPKLPIGEEAIIVASSNSAKGLLYSIHKFTIQKKQDIELKLSAITEVELNKKLKEIL